MRDMKISIEFMMDNLKSFRPCEFILENLSLEKQANELVRFYEHFGLRTQDGYDEKPISNKEFSECRISRIILMLNMLEKKLLNRII